jgi:hypothetical protein
MKSIVAALGATAVAWFLFSGEAHTQGDACLSQLQNSAPPTLINAKLAAKTTQLCISEFVVLHSGVSKTPVWSAEHLTAERIDAATGLPRPRSNAFHAESRLPQGERSELSDYRGSGFDRGHMSPNEDMSNGQAQYESFSLANMIPSPLATTKCSGRASNPASVSSRGTLATSTLWLDRPLTERMLQVSMGCWCRPAFSKQSTFRARTRPVHFSVANA